MNKPVPVFNFEASDIQTDHRSQQGIELSLKLDTFPDRKALFQFVRQYLSAGNTGIFKRFVKRIRNLFR